MIVRAAIPVIALIAVVSFVGCGESETATTDQPTPPITPVKFPEGAPLVVYDVSEMHCEGCANFVTTTLEGMEGVKMCYVDLPNLTATVAVEDSFDSEATLAILKDSGYPETQILSDPRPKSPEKPEQKDDPSQAATPDSDGEFTVSFE
jgi:copper chaperone CopZ